MREILFEVFLRPWSNAWYLGNTLDSAILLATAALGMVIAFRAGAFNLGGEAQIYAGGIAAAAVFLCGPGPVWLTGTLAPILALAIAALTGGASGLLKVKTGSDPLITSFLVASVVTPIGDWLVSGPLRDVSHDLLATSRIPDEFLLPRLLPPSSLNTGLFMALFAILAVHIFLSYSVPGLALRAAGGERSFARYAGLSLDAWITPALALSGALHGFAGYLAVAGSAGICHQGFPAGLGWNAIAVALIAGNRPLAIFPAALAFAWLEAGTRSAILASGMSLNTRSFIVATVFLLVTARRREKTQ